MNTYTFLAATDLSPSSYNTAQRAAMLAQQTSAQLELVHVIEKRELEELQRLLGEALKESIQSQTQKLLEKLANDIGKPSGVTVGYHLVEGEVFENITEQAKLLSADLLVIGARGASLTLQQLLGATAERLLRVVQCPVLTVKQPPLMTYQNVLVPIDFSPWSVGAINLAQMVAPQAKLTLLHAYDVPFEAQMRITGEKKNEIQKYRDKVCQDAKTRLNKIAMDVGLVDNWCPLVVHGNAVQKILEQEEGLGSDLVIIGRHGFGVVEEFLLGSNARQILIHAKCDVLVANR